MFFTTVGRVLAVLAIILGAWGAGVGFYAASLDNPALVARYVGSGGSAGAIDRGLEMIVFGIALGILTDISRSVRRPKEGAVKQGQPGAPSA